MKRLKVLLTKRRNHGFTLVEMIVSVALLAILLAGMVLFIAPILESYTENQTLYTAENVATAIQEQITHSLRNAYQVSIFTNATYEMNADAVIKDDVQKMVEYVNKKNNDDTIKVNRLYELHCMSLRYVNGQYILCNEPVEMTGTGTGGYLAGNDDNDALVDYTKAFSDVIYDGLYMDFSFIKPIETKDDGTTFVSKDTYQYAIKAYSDASKKSVVFNGSGMAECYAIKTMLRAKAPESEYFINIENQPEIDGNHDIYIYYVTRKLKGVTTP